MIRNKVTKQVVIVKRMIELLGDQSNMSIETIDQIYACFLTDLSNNTPILVYMDQLDSIVRDITSILCSKDIKLLATKYARLKPNMTINQKSENICEVCDVPLEYDNELYKCYCPTCGLCIDSISASYETVGTTSAPPDKRAKMCLDDIQGKRAIIIPENEWKRIVAKKEEECKSVISSISGKPIVRMKVNSTSSCANIRRWLAQIGLSKYNNNVPYIRKIVFEKQPYQLTSREESTALHYYSIMNAEYKRLFSDKDKKSSDPHAAYMFGKILEEILDESKWDILKCIHLQSPKTITARDKKWKIACESAGIMKGRPTLAKNYT